MSGADDETDANAGGALPGDSSKQQLLETYKSLEIRLSGDEIGTEERCADVASVWGLVRSLCRRAANSSISHLLEWAHRHTCSLIVSNDWTSAKFSDLRSSLVAELERFESDADPQDADKDWEKALLQKARYLKGLAKDSWSPPVLRALLDPKATQPTDDEVVAWLSEERGSTLIVRLQQLAASKKCDDLAFRLATAISDRLDASGACAERLRSEAGFTTDCVQRLRDIQLVLMHRTEGSDKCIQLVKGVPLTVGRGMVERLSARALLPPPASSKRLWKNVAQVATLTAQSNNEKQDVDADQNAHSSNENNEPPPKCSAPNSVNENKFRSKRSKLSQMTSILKDIKNVTSEINKSTDEESDLDIFGKYVAAQLKKLSEEQAIIAQEEIQRVLSKSRLTDLRKKNLPNVEFSSTWQSQIMNPSTSGSVRIESNSSLDYDYTEPSNTIISPTSDSSVFIDEDNFALEKDFRDKMKTHLI